MTLSAQQLASLVDGIAPLIVGGQIQKVWCAGPHALALSIRAPGQTYGLLISAEPRASRLHLITRKPDQPDAPTAFVMLLRKHLIGGRVRALTARPGDRVVRLDVDRRAAPDDASDSDDGAPQHTTKALVAELFGAGSALLALDGPEDRVLGTLRRPSGDRDLRPGQPYAPPAPPSAPPSPAPDLEGPDALEDPLTQSARLEAHYAARAAEAHADDAARSALQRLKRQHKALQRKTRAVEGDLERAEQAAGYKRLGELLQGAYGSPPERGATSVTVPDYYDPDLAPVAVALDPQLDLQGNIARYFKLYRRYHDALPTIEARLSALWEAGERIEADHNAARALAWRATEGRLGAAPSPDRAAALPATAADALGALDALLTGLEADGLLPPPRPTTRPRGDRQAAPALPYRTFTSRAGLTILVGKGNRDNDALSTRVARGRDLWLHAHDWAGAHVVVRLDRNATIDHQTLLDAATLAAHHSKGRNDTVVDVTYTLAKNVRKPKGYPPGRVTVADANTIAVRIEPERLARLFATRSA